MEINIKAAGAVGCHDIMQSDMLCKSMHAITITANNMQQMDAGYFGALFFF